MRRWPAHFAAAGYAVAVNYHRSEAEARALVEELSSSGYSVRAFQADVSDPGQAQSLVDNVGYFCQLDILICNAGVAWTGLLCDMTDTDYRRVLGTDLDGVFYCCRAAYRHMVHRKYGRILTISSMWGRSGASCEAAYSAAKAGVIGLTKALAQELGPSGVTVNCLAPGVIDTQMNCALSAGTCARLPRNPGGPSGHGRGRGPRRPVFGLSSGGLYHRAGPWGGRRLSL